MAAVRMGRNVRKAVASVRESAPLRREFAERYRSSCPIGTEEPKFACTDSFPRIGGIGASGRDDCVTCGFLVSSAFGQPRDDTVSQTSVNAP